MPCSYFAPSTRFDASLHVLAAPARPHPLRGGDSGRWEDPGGSQRRRGVERAGVGAEMGRSAQGSGLPGRRKAEYPAGTAGGACVGGPVDVGGVLAAVVTVTFNRADYLRRHVDSVLAVHARDRGNRRAARAGLDECQNTMEHISSEHACGRLTRNILQHPLPRRVAIAKRAVCRRARAPPGVARTYAPPHQGLAVWRAFAAACAGAASRCSSPRTARRRTGPRATWLARTLRW